MPRQLEVYDVLLNANEFPQHDNGAALIKVAQMLEHAADSMGKVSSSADTNAWNLQFYMRDSAKSLRIAYGFSK